MNNNDTAFTTPPGTATLATGGFSGGNGCLQVHYEGNANTTIYVSPELNAYPGPIAVGNSKLTYWMRGTSTVRRPVVAIGSLPNSNVGTQYPAAIIDAGATTQNLSGSAAGNAAIDCPDWTKFTIVLASSAASGALHSNFTADKDAKYLYLKLQNTNVTTVDLYFDEFRWEF
ncbi:MAG: hypothetical protein LBC99_07935 [Spirochaetota bacterium]|nr:hypothetical protein [Spirochaetota bacterium]